MSSQLKLVDITKKFEANTVNEKVALDHLNLTVEPGAVCHSFRFKRFRKINDV